MSNGAIFFWHSGRGALVINPKPLGRHAPIAIHAAELHAMGFSWDEIVAARSLPRVDTSSPIQTAANAMTKRRGR
jgi:hypothetical protein